MNSPYSNEVHQMTIQAGCPWYEAQQAFGAPNVNWCEPTLCALINEPANSWSNLAYLFVGVLLFFKLSKTSLKFFSYAVFFIGLMSFIYHSTNNYLSQLGDFIGMFTMMSFLLTFNMHRLFNHLLTNFFATYWFFVFINTLIFLCFGILDLPVQKIMLINALPIIVFDLFAGFREQTLKKYNYFTLTLVLLIVAQGFAIIDIQRIYCEPENSWLHGHVLWHLLSAMAMLFAGLHMKKIKETRLF